MERKVKGEQEEICDGKKEYNTERRARERGRESRTKKNKVTEYKW
jgi:hypothetical protein